MIYVDLSIQLGAQTCNIPSNRTLLIYLAEVNPLAHFNAKWHNNQRDMEILQLSKIVNNSIEAFISSMHELVNKYADVFVKPCKSFAQDIKHKIELLDPTKPIPRHRLQRISERESQ